MSGIPAGAGALLGKRLGKYEILALLALGGTAEIYLARIGGAAGFEKYVVVKCLHDHLADDTEFVKMFLDEARLAAHLDHSNIVQTMELGEHENRYYMVMEFLAGLSLAMVVRRSAERLAGGRVPVPLALNMVAQTCAGLHYAHERTANGKPLNIVHRDISPQNLVISFEGVVKIVDFGIAKAEMRETRTRSGTIKGKFAYMSPEQCVANNVDRRTDVFAAGVIAHELLTGKRLFKRPSPYETYQSVIECNVQPPSTINHELDPALDEVIMKAVAKDKDARYPTAEAFGDALLGYLHHRGKGSGPNEVSRFFDSDFVQEIEEHGARMRELIGGRDFSAESGVSWSEEDDEARKPQRPLTNDDDHKETHDFRKPAADQIASSSSADLSAILDDIRGDNGARADDDEIPADRTRIENNPMGRVNELEAAILASTKGDRPVMPPSGALPLPPAPSGKFPQAANLPTMIAGGENLAEAPTTAMGDPYVDPNEPHGSNGAAGPTSRPSAQTTAMGDPYVDPNELGRTGALGPAARPSSPTTAAPPIRPSGSMPPPMPGRASASSPAMGSGPHAGPMANGAMPNGRVEMPQPMVPPGPLSGEPMAEQPTFIPGRPGGTLPSPSQPPPMGSHPSTRPPPMGHPQSQPPPMGMQGMHPPSQPPPMGHPQSQPPPMRHPHSQPPPMGHPPSQPPPYHQNLPLGYPQMSHELGAQMSPQLQAKLGTHPPPSRPESGPQHAANLMSPVGPGYGQEVDWAAAAAKPAKAMPPWMLALIFIGALGIALGITIAIASALR